MRSLQDDAYVLRTRPLGEADWIVSLLAREHGLVRGVARGARRSRRRFGGMLEPLNEVHAVWVEKAGRDLHRLERVEPRVDWTGIQADPTIQALCAILCEVTESFSHEGQAEEEVYRLLGAVLQGAHAGRSPWWLLRYFEFWMLRLHGVLESVEVCGRCAGEVRTGAVVASQGVVLCRTCHAREGSPARPLRRETRERLGAVVRRAPDAIDADDRDARAGGALEALLRGRLEAYAERRFRTYRHLANLSAHEERPR